MEYFLTRLYIYALGTGLNDWWDNGDYQIAFCRGGKGFIAFNDQYDTDLRVTLQVNLTRNLNFEPLNLLAVS